MAFMNNNVIEHPGSITSALSMAKVEKSMFFFLAAASACRYWLKHNTALY
jgi:hypothetical protein